MNDEKFAVLVVDDESAVRNSLCDWFRKDGYDAETAADAVEALKKFSERSWDIVLLDIKMPRVDGMELQRRIKKIDPHATIIMITAYASVDTAVEALKEGAFDYLTKPVDPDELSRLTRKALDQRALAKENVRLRRKIDELTVEEKLIGDSPQVAKIDELIDTVAQSDVTVLIQGESGTGKDLIARLIHSRSVRKYCPLVPVNCGALPESLLESELFGHEKGSFTGAQARHRGMLELAHGGTLFLDEVATIGAKTQVDLLRVLETRQFTRIGGSQTVSVDFRIICATNHDLEQLVKDGIFREDFYYRINVFLITIPPLRERRGDIPAFVHHFVRKYAKQVGKTIEGVTPEAMEVLQNYDWPGNVGQLKNAIERAVVSSRAPELKASDLPLLQRRSAATDGGESLSAMVKAHILDTLERTEWNITQAARILEIDRVTLYNKIKKYGLKRKVDDG